MLYFSYGSNMSIKRLQRRVPSARFVAVSSLYGHQMYFHKASKDGSAKCDAKMSGTTEHVVIGVVFDILESEKQDLDRHEGLGYGYNEKLVRVVSTEGESIEAFTYYAIQIDPTLKPYHWYKEHVIRGAREHQLPHEYIQKIIAIESIDDLDQLRHVRELEIYSD